MLMLMLGHHPIIIMKNISIPFLVLAEIDTKMVWEP